MTGRSLRTSEQGIARAKRALLRKNLTRKAIANELGIASWSTVSKFFNGKPVDRLLFQEICRALDLDWEEVAATPELDDEIDDPEDQPADVPRSSSGSTEPSPDIDQLLKDVREQGAIARDALTPRILERIPRQVVRQKYLPAIARGVEDGEPHVIPIIGPAGYGKSTILSDLYDELIAAETAWVGLILCSSLSPSIGFRSFVSYSVVASTFAMPMGMGAGPSTSQEAMLANSLGETLCGESRSVVEVATELTQALGRGVLLIDTLDLVASRDVVLSFSRILRELVALEVTVVFTCRDREYNDYLEPTRERLPGLAHALYRYTVPNFSTAEIRLAAEAYFRKREPEVASRGPAFADNILNLSADSRSLQEIIENPLLLALLCELFAGEENVPPDLTVSKLYHRYWQEKVAATRLIRDDAALLAMEKETLCLAIARRLFELSQERLCESIYQDELGLTFTPILMDAYNDLLSEGVLTLLPSRKLHFFHQTLLEYAIAYWLTRHTAQPQRQQLFALLNQPDASLNRTYWLPVVRQLLTIVDTEAEFEQLVAQLNPQDLGVFGVICMAAASRDSPAALRQLLPTALVLGEAYQKRLRQAFGVASRQLIESIWDVLLSLLETGSHATAGNTAQLVGELIVRWWRSFCWRLPEALVAIARRQPDPDAPGTFSQGDWALLSGWLLQSSLEEMAAHPNPDLLVALHPYREVLGYRTLAALFQLHITTAVPLDAQWSLLATLLQEPVPKHEAVGRALCDWLTHLLHQSDGTTPTPLGQTWMDVLHSPQPAGWDKVQARSVGLWAATDASRLTAILQDLLWGPSHHLQQNLHALSASVESGASLQLIQCLQAIPSADLVQEIGTNIGEENFYTLSKLLTRCVPSLSVAQQENLVDWLAPLVADQIGQLFRTLDALADQSPTARTLLEQHMAQCSEAKQAQIRGRLLRFQPIEHHPPLDSVDKAAQQFLIEFYRQQAQTNALARDRLLAAARLRRKDLALAASKDLAPALKDTLTFDHLAPLLRSPYQGVRANALTALMHQLQHSHRLTVADLNQVCTLLSGERDQTVIRLLLRLVMVWARQQQPVSPPMLEALSVLPPRLVAAGKFEGGTARALLDALKAIAQATKPPDSPIPVQLTEYLLTTVNLGQVRNGESEMIDLLCAVNRLDGSFLAKLVHQHCEAMVAQGWSYNLLAIAKTIERVEGQNAALLDEILAAEWCTEAVSHLILETRTR